MVLDPRLPDHRSKDLPVPVYTHTHTCLYIMFPFLRAIETALILRSGNARKSKYRGALPLQLWDGLWDQMQEDGAVCEGPTGLHEEICE